MIKTQFPYHLLSSSLWLTFIFIFNRFAMWVDDVPYRKQKKKKKEKVSWGMQKNATGFIWKKMIITQFPYQLLSSSSWLTFILILILIASRCEVMMYRTGSRKKEKKKYREECKKMRPNSIERRWSINSFLTICYHHLCGLLLLLLILLFLLLLLLLLLIDLHRRDECNDVRRGAVSERERKAEKEWKKLYLYTT